MKGVRALALCAFVALSLAGCGESEEDRASAAVEDYFDALGEERFGDACALTTPAFRATLAGFAERRLRGAGEECEAILERLARQKGPRLVRLQSRVEVSEVEVDGERAHATLAAEGQTATLKLAGDDWRIVELDFSGATGLSGP